MTNSTLTAEAQNAIFEEMLSQIESMEQPEVPTREEANYTLQQLPPSLEGEALGDRIRRFSEMQAQNDGITVGYIESTERFAADSGSPQIPLPERAIEFPSGRLRLNITAQDDQLKIVIRALGLAIDMFANQRVCIFQWCEQMGHGNETITLSHHEVIAIFKLNDLGKGECLIDDRTEYRKALLYPTVGLIQDS